MQCLTNFVAFGNCICKLFQLAVKPGKLLLGEAGKFLRFELNLRLAFALSENSFIRRSEHLMVNYCNE